MYKGYFNIDQLQKSNYKKLHIFDNNTNLFMCELFTNTELKNNNVENIKHDIMSYGDSNYIGKFITNFNTLRFLAINPDKNFINKIFNKYNDDKTISYYKSYSLKICAVEHKAKYYKMAFDFDFKYDKYPEIYANYITQHEIITQYIIDKIITSLNFTLNLTKSELNYIWACKSKSVGYHIYFPNIITDRILHQWIYDKTIEYISSDKKYPQPLIKQIFDNSVCGGANGLRLFYYECNNDFYYPLQDKSTFKFDPEPFKHFHLCILNTDYESYNFNLKIHMDQIYNNNVIINPKILKNITKSPNNNIVIGDDAVTDFKIIQNADDKKSLIIGLANVLSIDRINDYNNWISIIYLFKNYSLYDELIIISKKSAKFDNKALESINKIFKNKTIKKDVNLITIGSLIQWAKIDNLELTNKVFSKHYLSIKLNINTIEDIVQSRFKTNIDFTENTQYISNDAVQFFKNKINNLTNKLFLIQSGTGTGKTTLINHLNDHILTLYPNYTILSIVTRRSMCACHISAFKSKKCAFTSYLDDSYETLDYFISSLEYLVKIDDIYDILILDEVNSLINYFYSSTLQHKRAQCISILIKLVIKAKIIIACDSNITDLVFSFFNQLNIKHVYYKNTFLNKLNIPLNIYYSKKDNENLNIRAYCHKFIIDKYIKQNKSVLILTDSKTITENLKDYFFKFNSNHDYYRVFNKDEGTLDDIININKISEGRLILANTRFLYGLDITTSYDEIFVIYRYSTSYGIDPFCMIQQMSRARNTKAVNMLVLDSKAQFYFNHYVSYDENKFTQLKFINNYYKFHDQLCKIYNAVNEFNCTTFNNTGSSEFLPNSIMTEIHFIKSWYDALFSNNKIDIVKLICDKAYGYKINSIEWNPDYEHHLFVDKIIPRKFEIIDVSKQIYSGNENFIDPKFKFCVRNLKEQISIREKYIRDINDPDLHIDIACDNDKFIQHFFTKYMKLNKNDFHKKIIDTNNKNIIPIIKNDEIINKINAIFFIEELLLFDRYQINDIQSHDINATKLILNANADKLYFIFKNKESINNSIKFFKNKISLIYNLNLLQKFVADCYNSIVHNSVQFKYTRVRCNNNLIKKYIF